MKTKLKLVSKLLESRDSRASYIRRKINMLVPAQLRALRSRKAWTQAQFAQEADMNQPRVSLMERRGALNFNLETLIRVAATHGLGLQVRFVPFSEMLKWEKAFNEATFDVPRIEEDAEFRSGNGTAKRAESVEAVGEAKATAEPE
jgi:transcriptional regulator with XRE-family HTH domain